jgi:hemoglobin
MEIRPGKFGDKDISLSAMGGEAGVKKLVDYFYDAMEHTPGASQIRKLHPKDLGLSREKLTAFLTGWLGGPPRYNERWGVIHIPAFHAHLPIRPAERDAWLECMRQAINQMELADDFRDYFMHQIARPADRCVNLADQAIEVPRNPVNSPSD